MQPCDTLKYIKPGLPRMGSGPHDTTQKMLSGLLPICRPAPGRGMLTSPFRVRQMSLRHAARHKAPAAEAHPRQAHSRPTGPDRGSNAKLRASTRSAFFADMASTETRPRMLYFALVTRGNPEKHYSTQPLCSSLAYCIMLVAASQHIHSPTHTSKP